MSKLIHELLQDLGYTHLDTETTSGVISPAHVSFPEPEPTAVHAHFNALDIQSSDDTICGESGCKSQIISVSVIYNGILLVRSGYIRVGCPTRIQPLTP